MTVSVAIVSVAMRMSVAVAVIMMIVVMMVVIVMMMVAKSVRPGVHKCSPALVEQPAADQDNRDAGNDSQNGNDLFRDDVARQQQRAESQQENADGVREGDGGAQERGMLHIAARSDQVGGDNGLAVTGLKSVHRAQPERDGDSSEQPSGAQLRLVQELGQIICVHTSSYLVLAFGAVFAGCGALRISSKYRSTKG